MGALIIFLWHLAEVRVWVVSLTDIWERISLQSVGSYDYLFVAFGRGESLGGVIDRFLGEDLTANCWEL